MGMSYGKISENLIHSWSKKKDGSVNERVIKYDGSFNHFPIEEDVITDHFDMSVDFIHLIQKSSYGRFIKKSKGCYQENKRWYIIGCDLDTEITSFWYLKLWQKDNENTCVIVNVLNAIIKMGYTETYNNMKHLQKYSV